MPPQIDHDPNEWKYDHGPLVTWGPWLVIAAVWGATYLFYPQEWHLDTHSLFLGLGTGGLIVAWGLNLTGNRAPDWMSGKKPGRPGDTDAH